MANTEGNADALALTVKGPSALKLSVNATPSMTVEELKKKIEELNSEFPAESGKVLKDAETLESYSVKSGRMYTLLMTDTIHMVRSAARATGPSSSTPSTTSANAERTPESQGIPSNFSAGQQFANNPLSALNRADYAGPQMANLMNDAGGMFGNFGGMNPRDPNVMLGMMQNPEFQRHMREMLSQPEVVDQIIASNPQMQSMAPQMREMLRSEHFREMLTNPESVQRMTQLSQAMGGQGGGAAWPPAGAFGQGTADSANATPPPNPFAALGGAGGAGGDSNPMAGLAQLQQLLGQGGAGANPFAAFGNPDANAAPADARPAEERFASQLEQLQGMGFYDGAANVRALLLSGGSVEGAVSVLLGN